MIEIQGQVRYESIPSDMQTHYIAVHEAFAMHVFDTAQQIRANPNDSIDVPSWSEYDIVRKSWLTVPPTERSVTLATGRRATVLGRWSMHFAVAACDLQHVLSEHATDIFTQSLHDQRIVWLFRHSGRWLLEIVGSSAQLGRSCDTRLRYGRTR